MKFKTTILILLVISTCTINVTAQVGDLNEQIKNGLKTETMLSGLKQLRPYVQNGRRGTKKQKATNLAMYTKIFISECNLAYARANKIIAKLEKHKNYELASKVENLRSDIYNMKYAANALIMYCQLIINKPKTHKGKTFNKCGDAFNTIIEYRNKLSKKRKILYDVVSWESYIMIKEKN